MILTTIQKNEIVNGYLGRLKTLNSMKSIDEVKNGLRLELNTPNATIFSLISIVSKIDQSDLIKQNTILPFRHSAVQDKAYIPDEFERLDISDQACFRFNRKGAVYCDQCVKEDLESDIHSYSFWKRYHQILGVDWCPIHNYPLKTSKNAHGFELQPGQSIFKFNYICGEKESPPSQHDVMYRYIKLTSLFLNIKKPVRARSCVKILGEIAKIRLGIRVNRTMKARGKTLTDIAKSSCSYPWLKRIFPRIDFLDQYEWFGAIDNSVQRIATPESFALALAIIFETTEEAINFMRIDLGIEI